MLEDVSEQSSKSHIKIDDIKRALQSGDINSAIALSQQALNEQENNQEKN